MESRHRAVAAGLTLTLALGAWTMPASAFADTTIPQGASETASSSGGDTGKSGPLPEPGDYDRALDYEEDPQESGSISLLSTEEGLARLTPLTLSSEMKYFAENESGSNYDQGFSYGDGYNAMGFYQFDRRYSLLPFIKACYEYNPTKYAMFAPVIERGDELTSGAIYDRETKQLTEIGQLAENAWHAAYRADSTEFSALQDAYAYQEYYLPVQRILKNNFGVDISGRADCVKGLAWGLCNLFGSGGCQRFFRLANLSDDMTDREFVNALCDAVVNNVDDYAYGASYKARYERERATCLEYIAEDEALSGDTGSDESDELPFFDVDRAWYYDDIVYVYKNGYMSGLADPVLRFAPNEAIVRQDVACVLYNIFGNGEKAPACSFADVDQSKYYADAINWAVYHGYMNGIGDPATGTYVRFGVNEPLPREQLASVAANIARKTGDSLDTSKYHSMLDWATTSPWATENVIWALNKGVIDGVSLVEGRYVAPHNNTTRAEMAAIVRRCIEKGIIPTAS